jgi:outer membrane protein OmpA-like peptidoglycan-associated protein
MGYSSAGGCPERRTTLLCVAALLLLAVTYPASSHATDLRLSSRTYLLYYERDVPGGETQRFAPLYEYLSGDAGNIGGSSFSFHFYGWGRQDLQDATGSGKTTGELGSAYLQYLHPTGNGEMRLGRFFLTEGAAAEIMDGLFLKVRTPLGLGVSAFGGVPAEASITATETGDSIYGGRVFYAWPGFTEIGVSYLQEKGTFQGQDRKEIGGDLWLRPFAAVELIGRASYNDATRALAFQRYLLRVSPVARVDLSVGYEAYKYKDYFQTALNPVFLFPTIDNNDKVQTIFASLDVEVVKGVTLTLGGKRIRHDAADPGDATRGEGGVKYVYNNLRDAAGVSAAVVTADQDENAYQEFRGFATYSPGKWRFALDGLTHRYKEAIVGVKNAYQVVGSAGYRLFDVLRLSGDLTYTKSPQFEEDYAGLVRVSLDLGTTTGGDGARQKEAGKEAETAAAAPPPSSPAPAPAAPPKPAPAAPPTPVPSPAPPPVPVPPVTPPTDRGKAPAVDPVAATLDRMAADIKAKIPAARVARKGEVIDLTLPSDLVFDVGRDDVKAPARRTLATVAEILNRHPNTLVTIEGHTDSKGTAESNQTLSEKRARSVFDILVKNGVHALRLTMRGYGELVPVADNSTPEGRRANRRVQMKIRPDANLKARQGQGR